MAAEVDRRELMTYLRSPWLAARGARWDGPVYLMMSGFLRHSRWIAFPTFLTSFMGLTC